MFFILLLMLLSTHLTHYQSMSLSEKDILRSHILDMFYHGYNNYMIYAFPHDELNPLTGKYTDSLGELGNTKSSNFKYNGVAMTLIDTLDTLAIIGDKVEFKKSVNYIIKNINFNIDIRVNLFEINIRLLGGLLSAHLLCIDKKLNLIYDYDDGLLLLAYDLGKRLLPAFHDLDSVPYAWVNLKHGLRQNEVTETCVAVVGTLVLEFGMLSHLTNDMRFYDYASKSLFNLWDMRSEINLLGNSFDIKTGTWTNNNAGIGSGVDSFYEYLFKAYILFGNSDFLEMYNIAYTAANKYLKNGDWYVEADMISGRQTHMQFNSLQAFWPGLQVMAGDLEAATTTHAAFYSIWKKYGALPERYLLPNDQIHSTEKYYPLRPELIESTYFLYMATKDPIYLRMGEHMFWTLNNVTRVEKGFASIKDVTTGELEDRMSSFFLAETCKYLYLLFDEDNYVLKDSNYIFTTEGHLFPVSINMHDKFGNYNKSTSYSNSTVNPISSTFNRTCSILKVPDVKDYFANFQKKIEQSPTTPPPEQANPQLLVKDIESTVGYGSFHIKKKSTNEVVDVRNLGTPYIEIVNKKGSDLACFIIQPNYILESRIEAGCLGNIATVSSLLGTHNLFNGADIKGEIIVPAANLGCSIPLEDVKDKVVLLARGSCTFSSKIMIMQNAGAIGVIISNDLEENNVFMMGGDGSTTDIKIPAVMISKYSGKMLRTCNDENPNLIVETITQLYSLIDYNYKVIKPAIGVAGNSSHFRYHTLGGWMFDIKEIDRVFHLSVPLSV